MDIETIAQTFRNNVSFNYVYSVKMPGLVLPLDGKFRMQLKRPDALMGVTVDAEFSTDNGRIELLAVDIANETVTLGFSMARADVLNLIGTYEGDCLFEVLGEADPVFKFIPTFEQGATR